MVLLSQLILEVLPFVGRVCYGRPLLSTLSPKIKDNLDETRQADRQAAMLQRPSSPRSNRSTLEIGRTNCVLCALDRDGLGLSHVRLHDASVTHVHYGVFYTQHDGRQY